MATDLERLVVRLEAQMRAFEREMARGRQSANTQLGAIENRFRQSNARISSSFNGLGLSLTRVFGAIGAGLSVRELQRFADSYTQIQNQLKVAGLAGDELDRVYQRLFASAQKNAAPFETLARLYSRIAIAQKELKVSSEEMLVFTDRVALALRTAGVSAEASRGALIQLSQAIGAGIVRAEEFNSILEGALPIAQAAAAGITEAGGSVAKLRLLIIDGKVSSEAFFRGFLSGSKMLQERAANMELTVDQAFTQLRNALTDTIGKINQVTGASSGAVSSIQTISSAVRGLGIASELALRPISEVLAKMRQFPSLTLALPAPILAIVTALQSLAAIGNGPTGAGPTKQLERLQRELKGLQEELPDAENTAAKTGLSIDKDRVDIIRARIALLQQEEAILKRTVAKFQAPPAANDANGGKPISLADYPVTTKPKVERLDTFERAIFNAQKRIELLNTETRLIDENSAAIERARLVVELETAAKAKNQAEGKKNIEVTKEQRIQIEAMADQMYRAADAADRAKSPLLEFARNANRTRDRLQDVALDGVKSFEDALVSLGDKSTTTAEKFRKMTASILSDLGRLLIRQGLTGPLAGALGGLFSGGGVGAASTGFDPWSGIVAGRAAGGPVTAGMPYVVGESGRELFVPRQDGMIIPNHALKSSGGGGVSVNYAPTIDARGADASAIARLERVIASDKATFEGRVVKAVQLANKSNVKLN